MWSLIEYLKRPELVVATQKWFGVEYLDENEICEHDLHLQTTDSDSLSYLHKSDINKVHRRNVSQESNESTATTSSTDNSTDGANNDNEKCDETQRKYRINNRFWYYLFLIGTELGDEYFYATMIPFWFWNIDGAVGRRVLFVWSVVMYVGQGLKDIIRWPRPGYPVQRLASKWSIEYGMPSTHAMVRPVNQFGIVFQSPYQPLLVLFFFFNFRYRCQLQCLSR